MFQFDRPRSIVRIARILFIAGTLTVGTFAQPPQSGDQAKPAVITPQQLSTSFAAAAKMVEPAVVSIDTKGKMPETASRGTRPTDPADLLDFLNRMPRRPAAAVGSGFIVDKRGYIMTNYHVVAESSRINVTLDSGEEYQGKVVGIDEETDLAVVKIEAGRELPVVKFGDSEKLDVGDWVIAIGSPFGLNRTVTAGIISQTQRSTPSTTLFQRFIQTDAAINRGNSGGPLVNMKGEVIGVNSQIATTNGDFNGIGFALPSTDAANVFQQILANGKVRRGYLGVKLESVKPEFANVYGMNAAKGAIVMEVPSTASPAAAAGLRPGDVIVEFDGKPVDSALDLIAKVSNASPDQAVAVSYLREAGNSLERRTANLRLGERPADSRNEDVDLPAPVKLPVDRKAEAAKPFGLTLAEVTPELASFYKIEGQKGALVKEIDPESYIADVKVSTGSQALVQGDLIVKINRKPVTDVKTFTSIANALKTGDAVVLYVLNLNPRNRTAELRLVQFTVQ